MRYKVLFCAALLLCGTPANAQDVVPFIAEALTDSTAPTTVRTGEPFTQVYKLQYIRSEKWGKEVIILEDEMRPKFFPAALGDFEIINWVLGKPLVTKVNDTEEHTRYLRVTLRIINPKKDAYIVPGIDVQWAIKSGDKIDGQEPVKTAEVHINYVTTITKDPNIDIRDIVYFDDYSKQAKFFWYISRVGSVSGVLIFVLMLAVSIRSANRKKAEVADKKTENGSQEGYEVVSHSVSFSEAYRNFFKTITNLESLNNGWMLDVSHLSRVKKTLAPVLSDLLKSHLEDLNPGDTPRDIGAYIDDKIVGPQIYKNSLSNIQRKLYDFQTDIESGHDGVDEHAIVDYREQIMALKSSVRLLKRSWRILSVLGVKT